MADKKISQLTGATTPLAGTEELPLVQGGVTKKVAASNLLLPSDIGSTVQGQDTDTTGSSGSVKSNATTGVLEVTGPAAGSTRVMTVPNADFTAARRDAAQTFSGVQTFSDQVKIMRKTEYSGTSGGINNGQSLQIDITMSGGDLAFNIDVSAVGASSGGAMFYSNAILRGALTAGGTIFGGSATNLANSLFSAATITGPGSFVLRITIANSSGVNANIWNNWAISIHTNSKSVSSVVASVV